MKITDSTTMVPITVPKTKPACVKHQSLHVCLSGGQIRWQFYLQHKLVSWPLSGKCTLHRCLQLSSSTTRAEADTPRTVLQTSLQQSSAVRFTNL